jgi:hypothetical protein
MPLPFYEQHAELKGVVEREYAAMCTSVPEVQNFIRDSVTTICRAVPDLAGFFTITASENLTNCWSHHRGAECPRCRDRGAEEVIAEVNRLIRDGIAATDSSARLIAWDWGWNDAWAKGIIDRLPQDVAHMSVSEWSIPITRGGTNTVVGEYSISTIGPGPRATRHWGFARERGLETIAKIQANNTWELSTVPYIPALENVARHAANLRGADVDGIMLGWTLGGCPSPNLEVVAELGRPGALRPEEDPAEAAHRAMEIVARRRFGDALAPAVVDAWSSFSAAFSEYPYHGAQLYRAPQQMGPANPLWEADTGYAATMVCFPYDNLDHWRAVYPAEVFIAQFEKMADGFDSALKTLDEAARGVDASRADRVALASERDVAEVCAIHFRSVANQARFVMARRALEAATRADAAREPMETVERILESEIALATRLHAIQRRDSRFGYEASNHYFYVPTDLAEKVVNCRDLLARWLPEERAKHGL